MQYTQELELYN